jgi:hypothetical protein
MLSRYNGLVLSSRTSILASRWTNPRSDNRPKGHINENRHPCESFCAAILLAGLTLSGPLLSQDQAERPKIKGTLPANWGRIGLSDEQKQQIFKIQANYDDKVRPLEKQIRELKAKEKQAMEAVLNDEQKKLLKEIILKKADSDKKDEKK